MIRQAVNAQAEDETLWIQPRHASEAYFMQSLRWLHSVIEDGDPEALKKILEQNPVRGRK